MSLHALFLSVKRRLVHERGAVLVEAALAVPILLLVILGAVEAGMAWEAKSATTSGVRTGLLRAASIGDRPETDLRIIQSVIGEVGAENVGNLEWIVIFDATNPNHAATVSSCSAALAGGGIFGTCNAYGSGTQFADVVAGTVTLADFDDGGNVVSGGYTCDAGKIDANWCASSRLVNGDVQIGVALLYTHGWFTGIFPGDGVDFEDFATSSTFVGDGSNISSSTPVTPSTGTVYDAGSFDGLWNSTGVWSGAATVQQAPADSSRNYLGHYGNNDSVDLMLTGLPAHSEVCVTFDVIIIGGWEDSGSAQDFFELEVDGTNVHSSTYSRTNPPAGATEINTLGAVSNHNSNYVVTITECVAHSAGSVNFNFGADMSAGLPDEGWGLDNVVVTYN